MRSILAVGVLALATAGALAERRVHTLRLAEPVGTPTLLGETDLRGPDVVVYDNLPVVGDDVFSDSLNPVGILDEATLFCGPGEPGPVNITSLQFGLEVLGTTPQTFDAVLSFFDTINVNATPVNSGLLGSVRVAFANVAPGVYVSQVVNLTTPINLPDANFGFSIQTFLPNTTTYAPGRMTPLFLGRGVAVGTSEDFAFFDDNANQVFASNEGGFYGGPPDLANLALRLSGVPLGPPPPPPVRPASACVGSPIDDDAAIPPGPLVISTVAAAGQVVWFEMALSQDVVASVNGVPSTDSLDIHTDGSSLNGAFPTDTVLSLYNAASGALVASNDDAAGTPPNTNFSALSFGDDLARASTPSGIAFAGENGSLPRGVYLIGISAFPAQTLPCAWRHSSTSGDSGTLVFNLVSNLSNVCQGDLNGDRIVNEADLGILLSAWLNSACGDLNRDGLSSEPDLGILLANWQVTCP